MVVEGHLDLYRSRIVNFDEGCSLRLNMEKVKKTLLVFGYEKQDRMI